ncbi:unnamed protein product [Sphagnum jensenii]|uniref:YEATS domain-containing protein n=1 Tax=Sphagnum jensenii TaxID=128206 RepID=A0ABP0WYB5_9BRYO
MKNFAAAQQEPGSARDQKGAAAMASSSPASSSLHAPYQAHKKQLPSGSSTTTSGASSSLAGGAGGSGSAGAVTTASSKRKRRLTDLTPEEINEIVALRGKMPQAVVGKKFGIEQTEVSAIQRLQRAKTARLLDDHEKKNPVKRVKGVELTVPIAYGTISFWLGKKAEEFKSHKWTVYVRGANNEDLGVVIKRVVFQLHPSFSNPTRTVEGPPFELSEAGWGEFEIGITIFFQSDVAEKPLELFHHLKLYPEDESGPQTTKKPVVVESYDEIVFSEPSEALYARISNHPAVVLSGLPSIPAPSAAGVDDSSERKKGDTKEHPLGQWFLKHSEIEELSILTAARQQVHAQIAKLKRELSAHESEALRLKSSTSH